MRDMKCSICVHLFVVLDHPEHNGDAFSVDELAKTIGAKWETVNWHLRHHLAAAGWATVTEALRPGARSVVRLTHNPSRCRTLENPRAGALSLVDGVKRASTLWGGTSPKSETKLSETGEVGIRNRRASSPKTEWF
jgi:hypothetical protein